MKRRLVLLAATGALAALTVVPSAAAPKLPPCAAFTDPSGDAGPPNDAALDITSASYRTVGKQLVATLNVAQLAERPTLAVGNRFQFDFQLDGHAVTLYYKHGPAREQEANAFYQQGIRVDDVFVNDSVVGTIKGNSVSIAVTYSELKSALGGSVLGKPLSGLTAEALASFVATNQSWDTATAPGSLTYVAGKACR